MSSELLRKNKQKPQKFFDKYRAKLAMAATVLTLATPAAIQVVQEGEFNPLAAIQAVSGDDISKEISTLKLSLVNTDGSEITNSTVNPYLKYRLNLKTESNITFGDNLIEVGDFFYINLPQELDYSAIQQMEASTTDFKYSIKVVDKDGQKQLRVEINDIMNLPFNAFKTEMTLPVTFADKTNGTVTLDANVANVQSNQQALTIKGRETKDISAQTGVTLQVMDSKFDSEITSPVDSTAVLGLQLTFDIGTNDLMPGDTFTVKLPTQLEYVDGAVVNIPNPEMQVVGKINNNDKTMTFEVLRVPQGTGNPEALVAQFATSFNALAIPEAGGNVTLTATTAKNSNSKTIKVISQEIITAKNDITNEVNTLTLTVTDGNGNNVKDSFVNPYKKYGMAINVDMGTKFGDKQVKPGDYIDIVLPNYMDYSGVGEMVNDTPTFKSVGTIINGNFYGQSVKVLRTLIKQVPRAGSNTVSFGFNLTVPFDIEKVRAKAPTNGIRYLNLLLQTEKASTSNLLVKIKDLNEPEPEPEPIQPSTDGEFVSPFNGLFKDFNTVLRAEYIGSEFWQHQYRKNEETGEVFDGGLWPYSVYTLVKVDRHPNRPIGGHDDTLGKNVDPTKKHWSASRGDTNQPNNSKIPNAGPENYINAYCMSEQPFRFTERVGDDTPNYFNKPQGARQKYVPYTDRSYRYNKYRFDDYFYRIGILSNLNQDYKFDVANKLQNVMAHSYPFVSEQEMREYFGFADHIKLSDIVAATQQTIWDILYFDRMFNNGTESKSIIVKQPYNYGRYTWQLNNNQLSTAYNPSDKYVYEAGRQMLSKQNIDYKTAHKVEIESTSFNQANNELTVNLSRAIDSSETANLTISANGKTSIPVRVKPNQTTYIVKVSDLIDGNSNKNQISISLEVTDKNGDVEFYIYSDQHAYQDSSKSQDVISCEMNPKKYSDQTSIEVEKPNTGKFEFVKYQTGTQYTIVGAEFELTNNSTGEKFTAVADLDGVVSFDKLPSGAYTLKETKAPEGYFLIEEEYQVTVGQDGNATLNDQDISAGIWSDKYEISNPEIKVEIIKQDAENETPLTGAVFQVDKVTGASEGYPKTFDTRDNSSFIIERLTDGEYTIAEIKAPEGYVKTEEIKKFTVNNGEVRNEAGKLLNGKDLQIEVKNNSIPIYNHPKPPEIIVKKVDQNGDVLPAIKGEANSGAEFTLTEFQRQYQLGGSWSGIPIEDREEAKKVRIGEDGKLSFTDLKKGFWYILSETDAPTDYEGTEKQWNVKVESDGSIEISEVAVKRVKTPAKNIKNADIQKTIQLVDGLLPTLSQKPKSVMKEFKEEQVSVKEAKKQEAKIDGSTITIVNQKLGKITIKKHLAGHDDISLSGAVFRLTKEDDATFEVITPESTGDGMVTIEGLQPGKYILEEVKAPSNYEISPKKWKITITENGDAKYSPVLKEEQTTVTKIENLSLYYNANRYSLVTKGHGTDLNSTLAGAVDADPDTVTLLKQADNNLNRRGFVGVQMPNEKVRHISRIHTKQAPNPHTNDCYSKYYIRYHDGNEWKYLNNKQLYSEKELTLDVDIQASRIILENAEYKNNCWIGLESFEVFEKTIEEKNVDYITNNADFQVAYPANDYGAYYLNLASKIVSVNPTDKTFTQYVYVNNYVNKENTSGISFDQTNHQPRLSIMLPEINKMEDISYKVYNVPYSNVKDLQTFDFNPEGKFSEMVEDYKFEVTPQYSATQFNIEFNQTLNNWNAAIVEITAKYVDDIVLTTNTFRYNLVNSNGHLTSEKPREITTKSGAYVFTAAEEAEDMITNPIPVSDMRTPLTPPEEGRVIISKFVAGNLTENATFSLFEGRLSELTEDQKPFKTGTTDASGELIFDEIPTGVYTLKEIEAPTGAIKTTTTWTIIVSEDGFTEQFENPATEIPDVENTDPVNRNENITVTNQNYTIYPYGVTKEEEADRGTAESTSTIHPNNGGLMKLAFSAELDPTVKPKAGDYFIVDIPDYMHDHGINPDDKRHVLENSNHEPIAIGKMENIEGNRVIKYTFTKYTSRMDTVTLNAEIPLSIDRTVIKNNGEPARDITYKIADKDFSAGKITVDYPENYTTKYISINSCIDKVDQVNETFETYIYLNPDHISGGSDYTFKIYDYMINQDNKILVSPNESATSITNIELFRAGKKTLPLGFDVEVNNDNQEDITWSWHKTYLNGTIFDVELTDKHDDYLNEGNAMIAKVTGRIDSGGEKLAISSKFQSKKSDGQEFVPGYPNFAVTQNWTYIRSTSGDIGGTKRDKYPHLMIYNEEATTSFDIKKVDEEGNPLADAEFTLTEVNKLTDDGSWKAITNPAEPIVSQLSDKDGKVVFDKVNYGTQYLLEETKAPAGYQLSSEKRHIQVDKDGTIHNYWEKMITNADFTIIKSDNYEAPQGIQEGYSFDERGAFDDDSKTLAIYDDPKPADYLKTDEFIGVDLGGVCNINDFTIKQTPQSNPNDYFEHAVLEYSEDNQNWTTLQTIDNSSQEVAATPIAVTEKIKARYVRLRATQDNQHKSWIAIDEFKATVTNPTYVYDEGKTEGAEITVDKPLEIINYELEYPETGSIGSIIFYMIGLTGMIGSAWMFTKKQ